MVHAVQIIDGGNLDVTLNVFLDAMQARTENVNSLRSLLPANQRNNATVVSAKASDFLQMLLDTRLALADIPNDDPAKITDPALPRFFQARVIAADQIGQGGNRVDVYRPIALVGGTATHLIGRETLVTVQWDGTTSVGAVNLLTETPPSALR